jgi:hypothetical protein
MFTRIVHQAALNSVFCVLTLLVPITLHAQQYGVRSFAIAPEGLNIAAVLWEHQGLSLDPGSILFKDADIRIDSISLNYSHYFGLFGKTAQVSVGVPYVFIDASTGTTFSKPPLAGLRLEAEPDGVADPYAHLAVALIGGESVSAAAFAEYEAGFVLHGLAAIRPPIGTYSNDVALNAGQNRWEFRLGLPVTQQWGKLGRQTTVEFTPVVAFYTDNDDPFGADRLEQDPLVHLEAHVIRDFIPGLLALGLDANYVFGGETTIDGIAQDNEQEYWTIGLGARGQFSRTIGWGAIYSRALSATDALHDSDWFRLILNYSF